MVNDDQVNGLLTYDRIYKINPGSIQVANFAFYDAYGQPKFQVGDVDSDLLT